MSENKNSKLKETFIRKSKNKYGDKYKLIGEYVNSNTETTFLCVEHNTEFIQKPVVFIRGHIGCELCNGKRKWTKESFIEKANKVHGNKYDYTNVTSVNTVDKIKIGCKEHGVFEMLLHSHIKGQGCPKCKTFKPTLGQEKFIEKAIKIHGDKYGYSEVLYTKSSEKVKIECYKHGFFKQTPSKHLSGSGCKECGIDKLKEVNKIPQEEIIERFKKVHSYKYDYSNVTYENMLTQVDIKCSKHGVFRQVPGDHIGGHGCPSCSSSVSNEENNFFNELNLDNVIRSSRSIIPPMQLDGYLPDFKLGIEYCGLYFHSTERLDKNYHLNKLLKSREKGIRLIQIFSDEWFLKKDIVKSRIKSILGKYEKIVYGRKTNVDYVDRNKAKEFLDDNHLQGAINSSFYIGLYQNEELLSLMAFNKPRAGIGGGEYDFEMSRYCVKKNINIIGGANKLLKFYSKTHKGTSIVTYADLRWSDGDIYDRMGFEMKHETKPNYTYIIGKHRESRLKFTKNRLEKEGYDVSKTEEEIMKERGIFKIYDCGVKTYIKKF